jgi:acyl dehydratase
MLILDRPSALRAYCGRELGVSEWVEVTQDMISDFANATNDLQWIHVDTRRAGGELPDGRTIAHGYLVLSMLPQFGAAIYQVGGVRKSLNYGANKLRFVSPVPSGSRIGARITCGEVETLGDKTRVVLNHVVELEGASKPALVADTIILFMEETASPETEPAIELK